MARDYRNQTGKNAVKEALKKANKRSSARPKSRKASGKKAMTTAEWNRRATALKNKGKRQYGAEHAKARKLMATNKRKREGTSSNYNPLSSLAANTKLTTSSISRMRVEKMGTKKASKAGGKKPASLAKTTAKVTARSGKTGKAARKAASKIMKKRAGK
jgi:hypothetical protein